ncbi:ABC transporter ATP-binding protein [Azohydromonas sp. G-1-1-14]|uniref:Spermidine/putrescine import ATP-binding protein PotA n=2 Tax=Azohydromonas caseinilytica TaxID=2728836 RepID=A0A848FDP4_9BURK|nr:ABC transporter ATP-binding protein [Azohydromonas caseinilytica]
MLELHQVARRFGDVAAVDGVSLTVGHREFFTLLGPSGCGKTTLLRLVAGFEEPDAGVLLLDGRDLATVPPERRPVHTVFQSYALFPHMTVAQNVGFALRMARASPAESGRRVGRALEEVGLAGLEQRRPHELSGGQRQRVAIARALIDRPRLLLLDEPLGALDAKLRAQMKLELITLQKEVDITFVYVTHDQGEALALSQRIAVMNRGRIEQVGTPESIYRQPANRFVADFIGQCNLLAATVSGVQGGQLWLEVEGIGRTAASCAQPVHPGQRGTFALRPEAVLLAPAAGAAAARRGRVRDRLYGGDVSVYTVVLEGGTALRSMQPNADPQGMPALAPGATVALGWSERAGHFLPE